MAKAPTQDAVAAPQAPDAFDLGAGRPALLPGSPIPDGAAAPASLHRDVAVRRLLPVADVVSAAASLLLAIALFGGIAAITIARVRPSRAVKLRSCATRK